MKKRLITFFFASVLLLTSVICRTGYIAFSKNFAVSSGYNSISVVIDKKCGTIYDCNMEKLTNKYLKYVAVIKPNEKCLSELNMLFASSEIKEIKKELEKGYPVVKDVDTCPNTKYIQIYKRTEHYSDNQIATHIISKYTGGAELNLQKYIDINSQMKISYYVDANGRILGGDNGKIVFDNYTSLEGVALTINKNIQSICENVIDKESTFKRGAVIVLDVNTGQIVACASRPNIDLKQLSNSTNDYVNRAFVQYSVGSVFKLIVAAAALEDGINPTFNCKGTVKVGDKTFECLKGKSHGEQNIKEALANSCNCYFVKLAFKLGADKVYDMAKKFGFDTSISINNNWNLSKGNIPNIQILKNSGGELALFSFGQGRLTASPIQFASCIQTIANDGISVPPTIVSGIVDKSGNNKKAKVQSGKRIISRNTAKTLQRYMRYVVSNGTASAAESSDKKSAGKTSTAQTGKFDGDEEILRTWIAGFYPYDNPKYAIVIVNENGYSGSVSVCPIFKRIVDNISK